MQRAQQEPQGSVAVDCEDRHDNDDERRKHERCDGRRVEPAHVWKPGLGRKENEEDREYVIQALEYNGADDFGRLRRTAPREHHDTGRSPARAGMMFLSR